MTTIPGATPNVTTAALRGLDRAERKAAQAAERIAAAGTALAPQDIPAPPASPEPQPQLPAPPTGAEPGSGLPVTGDLARPMVDLMVAQRAYQANAAVLRSEQEMRGGLPRALMV